MGDYVPVYSPGTAVPMTTSAAVTGGTVAAVSGDGTVGPATAGSTKAVGVFGHDAASGARVTVYCRGQVQEVLNSGGVTAGDQLVTATAGKVATLAAAGTAVAADINNARSIIGIALNTVADGLKTRFVGL